DCARLPDGADRNVATGAGAEAGGREWLVVFRGYIARASEECRMSHARRAIVQVRFGPLAPRKAVLEPGETLRVGRTELSDFRVPHDRQISGLHFQISW